MLFVAEVGNHAIPLVSPPILNTSSRGSVFAFGKSANKLNTGIRNFIILENVQGFSESQVVSGLHHLKSHFTRADRWI